MSEDRSSTPDEQGYFQGKQQGSNYGSHGGNRFRRVTKLIPPARRKILNNLQGYNIEDIQQPDRGKFKT
jgi:hypothetical protein